MAVGKKHHSLVLDTDVEGLPPDWRARIEDAVRQVGKAFSLYVTSVQAGVTRNPPRLLVSVSREGADEVWTERVEAALRARIEQVLVQARDDEAARQADLARLEASLAATARTGPSRIPATERERDASTARALEAKRAVVHGELRVALEAATLPPAAADLGRLALARMKEPGRFAMWAQILLAVEDTARAVGPDLERRLRSLL